jgi:hypothetical protein
LARIRNPNANMPDYSNLGPLSLQEYDEKHGNPFEQEGAPAGGEHAEKGAH